MHNIIIMVIFSPDKNPHRHTFDAGWGGGGKKGWMALGLFASGSDIADAGGRRRLART
jgi:hypothetical protein